MAAAAQSTSLPIGLALHPFAMGSAVLFGLLASHPMLALLMVLVVPFVAIWALVTFVLLVRRAHERRVRVWLLAIWALAVAVPVTLHSYRAQAVRAQADALATAVESHRARHGQWPAKLADIGFDDEAIAQRWRLWYRADKGNPALYYRATLTLFDLYDYDFERREWRLLPD